MLKSDSSRQRPCRSSEKGIALIAVIVFTLILAIVGFSVLSIANSEIVLTRVDANRTKAFYAAEAGTEYGVAKLNEILSKNRRAVDLCDETDISAYFQIPSPTLDGFTFDIFTIEKVGNLEMRTIDSGPYKGMEAFIQKYKITSQVTSNGPYSTSARLVQWIEDQRVSLFQFAAFYYQDLELEPGAAMTIKGRIHSNNNIYLTSGSTLSIDSYLTSALNIYRGNKPGDTGVEGGTVQIKDSNGDYKIMNFDSTDPDWATKAIDTWGGKVRSQVHGISELKLPIPIEDEPIEIIKRGDSKDSEALKEARLYWQADLRIIDGVPYDKSGSVVDLTYNDNGKVVNPVDMSKSFHNYREGKDIKVTEIDISKLATSGKFPANGILYVSTHLAGSGKQDGVRLVNGSALPSGGLTVATDNPLYIRGDYNLNKAPASVHCDAINILSNSWKDGQVCPPASYTQINSCILAGHTPTSDAGYGGGLENLFRFLELWSGKTFKWSGSINSLWYSEIATGKWVYGSPYYTAPSRDWEFDQQLLNVSNLPPGTPLVCISHRSGWEEVTSQ